ncbi:hypothetical protein V502_01012 [Pseudogymnoascus sp. VKM F-4520 (FW-2644)]|nr:hypothetical protein V502_01012 [Pseudogymnoascus sp. VKM F-4520 (FW-2644)]
MGGFSIGGIKIDPSKWVPPVQLPFEAVSNKLEQRTVITEPAKTSSPDDQITSSGMLVGNWLNITTVEDSFTPNHDLYTDITRLLTPLGIPAKFECGGKGKYEDIALLIANLALDRPATKDSTASNDSIIDTAITILSHQHDCIIQVKSSCYPALGNQGETVAWYAAIRVQATMTEEFHQAQLAKLPVTATDSSQKVTADLKWSSTIQLNWATPLAAKKVSEEIPGRFLDQNPGYAIVRNLVGGTTLTLQVAGPKGIKPAKIAEKVNVVVADFAPKTNTGDILVLLGVDLISSTLIR